MERTVTATDVDRDFPGILREVRGGTTIVVTRHGRPVARIVPYDGPEPAAESDARKAAGDAALSALLERLRNQPAMNIGPWTRDEIYDE